MRCTMDMGGERRHVRLIRGVCVQLLLLLLAGPRCGAGQVEAVEAVARVSVSAERTQFERWLRPGLPVVVRDSQEGDGEVGGGCPDDWEWTVDELVRRWPHVFEGLGGERQLVIVEEEEVHAVLARCYVLPGFLRGVRADAEFVFAVRKPGVGVRRHLDEGCENSLSLQLQGTKTWVLYPPAALDYTPQQVTLHPGDMLFFAPGWEHETTVEDAPSLSVSLYWHGGEGEPRTFTATEMFRSVGEELVKLPEYRACADVWGVKADAREAALVGEVDVVVEEEAGEPVEEECAGGEHDEPPPTRPRPAQRRFFGMSPLMASVSMGGLLFGPLIAFFIMHKKTQRRLRKAKHD